MIILNKRISCQKNKKDIDEEAEEAELIDKTVLNDCKKGTPV